MEKIILDLVAYYLLNKGELCTKSSINIRMFVAEFVTAMSSISKIYKNR
jgi:hypothetical protein